MPPVWMGAPQGSSQWLRERLGCLTASRMADAMDMLKKGGEGAKRRQLKIDIVAERLTYSMVSRYVNDAMQWGIEHEADARDRYEAETGTFVDPCGFALHGEIEFFGASPDGLVGDDGLIEIKCPSTSTFIGWLSDGVVPEQHKPQMLAQLAVTGRKWCDFFAYDPRVMVIERQYFLARYTPTPEEIASVEEAARQFLSEVDDLFCAVSRVPEQPSVPSPGGAAAPPTQEKEIA